MQRKRSKTEDIKSIFQNYYVVTKNQTKKTRNGIKKCQLDACLVWHSLFNQTNCQNTGLSG